MDHVSVGQNADAPFTLKVYRGEGMALLAMNWRGAEPSDDFVGFAIEFTAPWDPTKFMAVSNRLTFEPTDRGDRVAHRSLNAPIQMFRWVHFPPYLKVEGDYTYRVTPVFMDEHDHLTYGPAQVATITLGGPTHRDSLDVAFTRGFVSSQAFVDRYDVHTDAEMGTLVPDTQVDPLAFTPTHHRADDALAWMGFEARDSVLGVLDAAIADASARVRFIAYDLNMPEIVDRLVQLGDRVRVIVDDSAKHGEDDSPESEAAGLIAASAGPDHVRRQHMGDLQHNKVAVVDGDVVQKVVCGSTNFSWRGFYVQNNHAVQLVGPEAVALFGSAFEAFWEHPNPAFASTSLVEVHELTWPSVGASVTFSPHSPSTRMLDKIAADIRTPGVESVLYSLAFLGLTSGSVREAITEVTENPDVFVYGVADQNVAGIEILSPDGNLQPVHPAALSGDVPEPFRSEPTGRANGVGTCMHHKFVVLDFGKPEARVWLGSFNFSRSADKDNGENLILIRDPGVTTSFAIEAIRIFDHYSFRLKQQEAHAPDAPPDVLLLTKPPRVADDETWWRKYYVDGPRRRDRLLFA